MSVLKYIKKLLTIIPVFLAVAVSSQNYSTSNFYKHFTGSLDTSMSISMDMFSQNGKISGFYYYFFPDPGNKGNIRYGKTIPIEGTITGNTVVINEFSNYGSSFNGNFDNNSSISGTWQRRQNEKAIPFLLKENYSDGSTPFTCYSMSDQKYIKNEDRITRNSPKAKINLVLLYPDLSLGSPLKETIDATITKFLFDETAGFSSPRMILENLAADFFNSYFTITDGLETPSSRALFHWEKNISMNICYNENNIISLKIEKKAYTGGPHSITMTEYFVCDLGQRKRLTLDDIFRENSRDQINIILNEKLRKMNGILPVEDLSETGFFMDYIECTDNFYINKDGIGFYYNLYHIASYSSGPTEIFLPFSEIQALLNTSNPLSWIDGSVKIKNKQPY